MLTTLTATSDARDSYRHWSRASQPYAPGDILIHYLQTGWTVGSSVMVEPFYLGDNRHVNVLCFTLSHQDQTLVMPVINNPRIERLLKEYGIIPVTCGAPESK